MVTSVHKMLRSEVPGWYAPAAADPYNTTDSIFFPAASVSRLTSSVSLVSIVITTRAHDVQRSTSCHPRRRLRLRLHQIRRILPRHPPPPPPPPPPPRLPPPPPPLP